MGRFRQIPQGRVIARFGAVMALCVVVVLVGLAQANPAAAQTTLGANANVDFNVNIAGGIISPARITVYAGTRVIWANRQLTGNQTVTSDSGVFASGTLQPGQSFTYTFNQPGTYPFHSDIAPQQIKGVVIVQPAMPVQVQIASPPPPRATPSGFELPGSNVGLLPQQPPVVQLPPSSVQLGSQLPPEAPPPSYLPLASAPPPPVRPTPVGYVTYGYSAPGAYLPALPHAGGGGAATSFTAGSEY